MNVAFISYEYPPDTADGGIATYVRQAARMLASAGHRVEVFAGSRRRGGTEADGPVLVHRVCEADVVRFAGAVGGVFARRHGEAAFDVVEGPDYFADAREAVRLAPEVPLVVRLHTPAVMARMISRPPMPLGARVRTTLGAWRRGTRPYWHPSHDPENAYERAHAREADVIAAPCRSIAAHLTRLWGLDRSRVRMLPYPYAPSAGLLAIPPGGRTGVVTFLGRVEFRKGVLDLARAIPMVLRRRPDLRFRFVGRSGVASPEAGVDMITYLRRRLGPCGGAVEFPGPVAPDRIPEVFAGSDVCVFPSVWENFPNVCLEAMAAARAVVGSAAGGMAEQLDGGRAGLLVPPRSPRRIAAAVLRLAGDERLRAELGAAARRRILEEYAPARVVARQVEVYREAIERRKGIGPRGGGAGWAPLLPLGAARQGDGDGAELVGA